MGIGGGGAAGKYFAYQDLDVYGNGSDASDAGSIHTTLNTSNILGFLDSTQFTVHEYNVPADDFASALDDSDIDFSGADFTAGDLANALETSNDLPVTGVALGSGDLTGDDVNTLLRPSDINLTGTGVDADAVAAALNGAVADYSDGLPDVGSVYSVTDFGLGISNVYIATPDADGDAAASIQDFLVTPFGNVDLSTMFDAIAAFDPGDAAAGVTDATADGAFNIFDPSTWF